MIDDRGEIHLDERYRNSLSLTVFNPRRLFTSEEKRGKGGEEKKVKREWYLTKERLEK